MLVKPTQNEKPGNTNFSGERYMPFIGGNIELEHLHRYYAVNKLILNKVVADIACGEGYGCNILADFAKKVIGIDISEETILNARECYKKENLSFECSLAQNTKIDSSSIDVITCFETIEHHVFHDEMLKEFKRILKPDGILIISTPDKYEATDRTGVKNPHHEKELYKDEFASLISRYFENVKLVGQKIISGSAISSEKLENFQGFEIGLPTAPHQLLAPAPLYWIAIASDFQAENIDSSILFDHTDIDKLRVSDYENEERKKTIIQRDADIAILEANVLRFEKLSADRQTVILQCEKDVEKLNTETDRLRNDLRDKDRVLQDFQTSNSDFSAALSAIQSSTSWKITKPIRALANLFKSSNG